jgi:hypothetical protein
MSSPASRRWSRRRAEMLGGGPSERALHAALIACVDAETVLALVEAAEAHAVTLGCLHARYPSEEVAADAARLREAAALLNRANAARERREHQA